MHSCVYSWSPSVVILLVTDSRNRSYTVNEGTPTNITGDGGTGSGGLSTGGIVGFVLGGVTGLGIVALVLWCIVRKRRPHKEIAYTWLIKTLYCIPISFLGPRTHPPAKHWHFTNQLRVSGPIGIHGHRNSGPRLQFRFLIIQARLQPLRWGVLAGSRLHPPMPFHGISSIPRRPREVEMKGLVLISINRITMCGGALAL